LIGVGCLLDDSNTWCIFQAIIVLALAVCAYAEEKKEETVDTKEKRGVVGLGYGAAPALTTYAAAPAYSGYAAPAYSGYAAPAYSAYAAPAIAKVKYQFNSSFFV
jgi:hypothetical protein